MKSSRSHQVGIALGSNLGDRLANLQAARKALSSLAVPDSAFLQAPVYRTEPVGCPDGSPDFFNTVVVFEFEGTPTDLLAHTQAIEAHLGRVRSDERNAPRVIDVDILFFGQERVETNDLILPHPRLTLRRFVLQPLADIQPALILPGEIKSIADHLGNLDSDESPLVSVQATW